MARLEMPRRHDPAKRAWIDPGTGRFTSIKSIYSEPDALADLILEVTDTQSDQIVYGYGACGAECNASPEEILLEFQNIQDLYHIGLKGGKRAYHEVLKFYDAEIEAKTLSPIDLWNIGLMCCKVYFTTYEFQAMFSVNYDSVDHYHIEFIVNSVSFADGHKWSSTPEDMEHRQEHFNVIIDRYLSIRSIGGTQIYR